MSARPRVLFICVKNAGKSQMAAGLMRQVAGDAVVVSSAGTAPGAALNEQSVAALLEVGVDISAEHPKAFTADISAEHPKAVTADMLRAADVVVTLGQEAHVDEILGPRFETWVTDEPSERGVNGVERMRLIRDLIAARVTGLARALGVPSGDA